MKKIIILILLFIPIIIFCQNPRDINFIITDSVVVKKDYPYATKVNVEINVPNFQSAFFLYYFYKCVGSLALSEQITSNFMFPIKPMGLEYVIEDKNHEVIECQRKNGAPIRYPSITGEYNKHKSMAIFVNSKQKIISKKLNYKQKLNYILAKQKINKPKQEVVVFLLLNVYHTDLPKGIYYLYLAYDSEGRGLKTPYQMLNDSRAFRGSVVSNKVKLIVE